MRNASRCAIGILYEQPPRAGIYCGRESDGAKKRPSCDEVSQIMRIIILGRKFESLSRCHNSQKISELGPLFRILAIAQAAAVDWLDAYRAGELDDVLGMFADAAVIHCVCGGQKTLTGGEALRAYWVDRFKRYPALGLHDLKPSQNEVAISYITTSGFVSAVLAFDAAGQIKSVSCRPLAS
ncbi:nuclear transport factor 2 family protein [Bradyrhizobium sp. RD5-C2]|uniref:nuclear transport factor 2 family protein n=1 Tax=Bradyrhizobium sp. RD5-C2 TaxID=244562 RepID=UPI001CC65126|nr:nuclear transport factor 2 family protein [Bradyrhizobium sp. RD5-C2]GIQ78438.1 hypothetical protein BraRD5C2_68890 [Bradyrhizobium sp. RD5-C2]